MASRGEVWLADLNPTKGHEQRGTRPALIVSANGLNSSGAGIVIVVPLTTTDRGVPSHVRIDPPEGGLQKQSFALCEQIRAISDGRLVKRLGSISPTTQSEVQKILGFLLG